ncbi:MAG: 30S ribosomal protein S20 [Bacteroidales bacterium]
MANHKSAKKRVRSDNAKKLRNRYYAKSTRTAVRKIRGMESKSEAEKSLPRVISMIDRLAKKSVIHKNKAANLKGKLTRHVNNLQ